MGENEGWMYSIMTPQGKRSMFAVMGSHSADGATARLIDVVGPDVVAGLAPLIAEHVLTALPDGVYSVRYTEATGTVEAWEITKADWDEAARIALSN